MNECKKRRRKKTVEKVKEKEKENKRPEGCALLETRHSSPLSTSSGQRTCGVSLGTL